MTILQRLRGELAPIIHFGLGRFCNVCGHRVRGFAPLGSILNGKFIAPILIGDDPHPVSGFETLNVDEFLCPLCGSQDKARLYALFLSTIADLGPGGDGYALLHFAPEGGLSSWIRRSYPRLAYTTTDLFRDDVDVNLDVTCMDEIPDGAFDAFIFSHVLEHVDDEAAALSELRRILKRDGWGIIMVPVLLTIDETYTDPSIVTPEERAQHFGLEDHLRVHSRDGFLSQLHAAQFRVREYTVNDWTPDEFTRLGISHRSVLYVVIPE